MFNTILTYAGLPARWIVHALGFPESLQYTPYFLANLVVVVTLLFSWYCWLVWLRHRYVFYLFLYLVSVAAAVVGFFATISYRHAWVYACVWITLGFVFFVSTQRS